jgi:hypothetical protein
VEHTAINQRGAHLRPSTSRFTLVILTVTYRVGGATVYTSTIHRFMANNLKCAWQADKFLHEMISNQNS